MAMSVHLDIVSAEGEIFSGRAEMVAVSGSQGELGIMPGHTPLLTTLKPGLIRVTLQGGKQEVFYISGGTVEVQPDIVTVLADTAVRAEDLDEIAAMEARQRAEKTASSRKSNIEYSQTLSELADAAARLRAIKHVKQIRKKFGRGE
ncbi:MAG: F0F1 ATP synthase subunit epsilon [Gammaproteobacteria bacterium]|nr:F0F1 ATP synthase subunit epsilon [Gammaproteobacteria bacterium]